MQDEVCSKGTCEFFIFMNLSARGNKLFHMVKSISSAQLPLTFRLTYWPVFASCSTLFKIFENCSLYLACSKSFHFISLSILSGCYLSLQSFEQQELCACGMNFKMKHEPFFAQRSKFMFWKKNSRNDNEPFLLLKKNQCSFVKFLQRRDQMVSN